MEKPKLRYERREVARPSCAGPGQSPHPAWVWSLPPDPGAGPGDAGRLTAAAASCAGSPWPPPPAGCSAPGSGKSAGDQDWRPPLGAIPRQASEVLSRDFGANSPEGGERPKAPGPRPGGHPHNGEGTVSLSPHLLSQTADCWTRGHFESKAGVPKKHLFLLFLFVFSEQVWKNLALWLRPTVQGACCV